MKKGLYMIFCGCTAVVGMEVHGSTFWSVINFLLAPISWMWWIICKDVNVSLIERAFDWFLK